MKKTILVICALSAAHTQALGIKNDLLSEVKKNHKEARQLIKMNKEQEKKQEREERKNIVMTKNEAVALTVGTSLLLTLVGCAVNSLVKGDPKTVKTAIISVFVGTSISITSYYEHQKEKPSRRLSRLLDIYKSTNLISWGDLLLK